MLRYKVYQVVTHPQFPKYAYWASWVAFVALFWAIWTLQELGSRVFISENALSPQFHGHHISPLKSPLPPYQGNAMTFLLDAFPGADIEAFPPAKPSTYSFLYRSPRATAYECMALLFPLNETDFSSVELAVGLHRYIQTEHKWLGKNLLFLFYKAKLPYAQGVRSWLSGYFLYSDISPRYFGLIRLALVLDIGSTMDYVTVLHDGINGQQVDVDLLATSTKILESGAAGVPLVHPEPASLHPSLKHLSHAVASWQKIVDGNVHSPHSYFLQYGIVSLTWKTVSTRPKGKFSFSAVKPSMLSLAEQFLRTVTGLDEQLHAGYYFYFLTKPDHFLPLSKYAYLILFAMLPILFHAVLLLKERREDPNSMAIVLLSFLPSVANIALRYAYFADCDSPDTPPVYALAALFAAPLLLPIQPRDWQYLKGLASAVTGVAIMALSLYFLPLGLLAGVLLAPLKVAIRPVPLPKVVKWSLAVLVAVLLSSVSAIDSYWEAEKCSGHLVWTALQLALFPSVLQLFSVLFSSNHH